MPASANPDPSFVLVVDDDLDMAMMLGEFVQAVGIRVECASDYAGFMAMALQAPRLVLLDLLMPDRCSERAVAWLSEHAPDTRLILVSSLPISDIEQRARSAREQGIGQVQCLRKPCWPSDVADLLKRSGLVAIDTCAR